MAPALHFIPLITTFSHSIDEKGLLFKSFSQTHLKMFDCFA